MVTNHDGRGPVPDGWWPEPDTIGWVAAQPEPDDADREDPARADAPEP
jgi:hypothetical protein